MVEDYVSAVRDAAASTVRTADQLVHGGTYQERKPVGETVSEEGVDFGLLHNAVREYASSSSFARYQQVVDRAGSYVAADRTEDLSREELTTLLQASLEVEMRARTTAEQYEHLQDVYATEDLAAAGIADEETMARWRELSDDEVREQERGYLEPVAKAERLRRDAPRADEWYAAIKELSHHVEEFVRHQLEDDTSYRSVREDALHQAADALEASETGRMETLLGPGDEDD